ncbi:MAG: hypothetical protein VW891_15380, partial [Novosphingobium sp.]
MKARKGDACALKLRAMRVTKKKIAGIATTILMLLSLARVVVLFFESFAGVRDERNNDLELLE